MGILEYLLAGFMANSFEQPTNKDELRCMTMNIWHEARGEDMLGWAKVAQTVLNRMKDPRYPSTACGVIWDKGQFEWTFDNKPDAVIPKDYTEAVKLEEIISISSNGLAGHFEGIINGSVMYWNPNKVTPCWESAYDEFTDHGNHRWAYSENGTSPCYKPQIASNP